jgi:hypothetical protein
VVIKDKRSIMPLFGATGVDHQSCTVANCTVGGSSPPPTAMIVLTIELVFSLLMKCNRTRRLRDETGVCFLLRIGTDSNADFFVYFCGLLVKDSPVFRT